MPVWGTFDTEVQKAWAARAATAGLAGIYGPDDREMVRVARAETGSAWGLITAGNLPRTRIDWENGCGRREGSTTRCGRTCRTGRCSTRW